MFVFGKEIVILIYIKKYLMKLKIEYSMDENYGLIVWIFVIKEKFLMIFFCSYVDMYLNVVMLVF